MFEKIDELPQTNLGRGSVEPVSRGRYIMYKFRLVRADCVIKAANSVHICCRGKIHKKCFGGILARVRGCQCADLRASAGEELMAPIVATKYKATGNCIGNPSADEARNTRF